MIHTFNRFSCLSVKWVWLSQWCGTDANYCDACCQNGPCTSGSLSPPSTSPKLSSPPPPTPPTDFNNSVNHGEDSRLIGYVGSLQACLTPGQYNAYSHMVVAFAVSYTYHCFAGGSHRHKNVVSGSILCRHDRGMSAKCCRAKMSATFLQYPSYRDHQLSVGCCVFLISFGHLWPSHHFLSISQRVLFLCAPQTSLPMVVPPNQTIGACYGTIGGCNVMCCGCR